MFFWNKRLSLLQKYLFPSVVTCLIEVICMSALDEKEKKLRIFIKRIDEEIAEFKLKEKNHVKKGRSQFSMLFFWIFTLFSTEPIPSQPL